MQGWRQERWPQGHACRGRRPRLEQSMSWGGAVRSAGTLALSRHGCPAPPRLPLLQPRGDGQGRGGWLLGREVCSPLADAALGIGGRGLQGKGRGQAVGHGAGAARRRRPAWRSVLTGSKAGPLDNCTPQVTTKSGFSASSPLGKVQDGIEPNPAPTSSPPASARLALCTPRATLLR